MRILLLADHRYRDTPALAAIQIHLETLLPDSDVRVVSFDLHREVLELFKPHVVVINHLHGKRNQKIADTVKRSGGLVVVLPTEGRPNTNDKITWAATQFPPNLCDLYLCWSEQFAKRLPNTVPYTVTGGPRFDFYYNPLSRAIQDKFESRGRLELAPTDFVVSIATSFPQAKFSLWNGKFNDQDWKDLKVTSIPGYEEPAVIARQELEALNVFKRHIKILRELQPSIKMVLKPHPAESPWLWERFCYDNDIILSTGNYIWDILSAADLHIARTDCLTLCEAWYMNIKTVAIDVGGTDKDGPGAESSKCTLMVANPPEIEYYVVQASMDTNNYQKESQLEYNKQWLTPSYGGTIKVAESIVSLLVERTPVVPDIAPESLFELSKLLSDHDKIATDSPVDFAMQMNKSVRRRDTVEWLTKIREIL